LLCAVASRHDQLKGASSTFLLLQSASARRPARLSTSCFLPRAANPYNRFLQNRANHQHQHPHSLHLQTLDNTPNRSFTPPQNQPREGRQPDYHFKMALKRINKELTDLGRYVLALLRPMTSLCSHDHRHCSDASRVAMASKKVIHD
jgi:hypothetical protein